MICVIKLVFSESKKSFQKKARCEEFPYSSERARRGISKPNCIKGIPLLSRNLELNYPRNKLIPYKCTLLWKTQNKNISNLGKLEQQRKNRFQVKLRLENSSFVQKLERNFFCKKIMLKNCVIVIVVCVIDLILSENK